MISCRDAEHRISRLLDGELPRDHRAELEEHIKGCPSCRSTLHSWSRIGMELTDLTRQAIPQVVVNKPRPAHQPAPARRSWLPWAAAGAAAALLIALLFFTNRSDIKTPNVNEGQQSVETPTVAAPRPLPPPVADERPAPVTPLPPAEQPRPQVVEKSAPPPEPPKPIEQPKTPPVERPPSVSEAALAEAEIVEGAATVDGRPLAKGSPLFRGSTVEMTGAGRAKLTLADRSELYLNTGTRMEFLRPETGQAILLRGGEIFACVAKQHDALVVRTSSGEARVTGTEFDVKTDGTMTTVLVASGGVECRNDRGGATVTAARRSVFSSDQPPSMPERVDLSQALAWTKGMVPDAVMAGWKVPDDPPSQQEIDKAIDKGVAFLKKALSDDGKIDKKVRAFMAYALAHCGCKPEDPELKAAVDEILSGIPKGTYDAGIIIMTLGYFDPDNDRYRERIAECAQYLVGSQTPDGQWDYGLGPKAERGTSGKIYTGKKKQKDDIFIMPPTAHYATGTKTANNSNSQFAILALHAAAKARVYAPKETWELNSKYWTASQNDDGGWGYAAKFNSRGTAVGNAAGTTSPHSAVWFDDRHQQYDYVSSYGNMTCAALAGLAVSLNNLGKDYKKEKVFKKGMEWLEKNFSIETIPGKVIDELVSKNKTPQYYYYYSLERACAIAATDRVGAHDWYGEGATYILKNQKPTGEWESQDNSSPHTTTCYALLFLKRASTGIIETGTK